jgi:hypothetical protein
MTTVRISAVKETLATLERCSAGWWKMLIYGPDILQRTTSSRSIHHALTFFFFFFFNCKDIKVTTGNLNISFLTATSNELGVLHIVNYTFGTEIIHKHQKPL